MKKTESTICPKIIGKRHLTYNLDTYVNEDGTKLYRYEEIDFDKTLRRDDVISAIIRVRYSIDDEIAMINNILVESPAQKHIDDYNDYQEYRELAKTIADIVYLIKEEDVEKKTVAELDELADTFDMSVRNTAYSGALKEEKISMLKEELGL